MRTNVLCLSNSGRRDYRLRESQVHDLRIDVHPGLIATARGGRAASGSATLILRTHDHGECDDASKND
jgi:hypothetical protein